MLKDHDAVATIAVHDLNVARKFYEGSLGLEPMSGDQTEVVRYRSGKSILLVYRSSFAGTNKASAVTWGLGKDFGNVVKALQAKRVPFEHYDGLPGLTRKGDVHVAGPFSGAWIEDPDGNILHINNQ